MGKPYCQAYDLSPSLPSQASLAATLLSLLQWIRIAVRRQKGAVLRGDHRQKLRAQLAARALGKPFPSYSWAPGLVPREAHEHLGNPLTLPIFPPETRISYYSLNQPYTFTLERGVLAWSEQLLKFGGKWGPVFVQRSCMSMFTLTLMMFERKLQTQRKARLAWGLGQSSCWYLLVLVSESETIWAWLSTCMMRPGDGKKGEKSWNVSTSTFTRSSLIPFTPPTPQTWLINQLDAGANMFEEENIHPRV